MANDIIFKTKAFGGFNKEDVMTYVNKLLHEKSEVEKLLFESNLKNEQLNEELLQCKKATDESEELNRKLQTTEVQKEELEAKLMEKDIEITALNDTIDAKNLEIHSLNVKLSEAVFSEEAQKEIDNLRTEVARLKSEAEKKRDIERQVGAAMLDARIHSEGLVEEAKERANAVTKGIYSAIGETAVRIDGLSGNISEIARSFAKSVEEVELRIKALTGDMSKTAQLLISDSGIITESAADADVKPEYDFSAKNDFITEVKFEPTEDN